MFASNHTDTSTFREHQQRRRASNLTKSGRFDIQPEFKKEEPKKEEPKKPVVKPQEKKDKPKRIDDVETVPKKQSLTAVAVTDESVIEGLIHDTQSLQAHVIRLSQSLAHVGTVRETAKLWSKIRSERKMSTKLHDRIQRRIERVSKVLQFMLDQTHNDNDDMLDPTTIKFKREQIRKISVQFAPIQSEYDKILKDCLQKEEVYNKAQQKEELRVKREQDEDDLLDDEPSGVKIKDVTPLVRAMSMGKKTKDNTPVIVDSDDEDGDEGMSFFEFLSKAADKTEKKKIDEEKKKKEQVEQLKQKGIDVETRDIVAQQLEKKKEERRKQKQIQVQEQEKKIKFILSSADQSTFETEMQIASETNQELKALESDFLELHDMFTDLNMMVKEQQHGINIIMHNVETANEHVLAGIEHIKEAKNYTAVGGVQNMARKVGAMVTFMK